jgi:hypothetical protein
LLSQLIETALGSGLPGIDFVRHFSGEV